jgi:hypothetical protein
METGAVTKLAGGHDFYMAPRLSPDGTQLAWVQWDHPVGCGGGGGVGLKRERQPHLQAVQRS